MNTKNMIVHLPNEEENKPSSAYNAIKELIFCRALHPGQKLNYQELSDAIGLSKTPIINALSILQSEGFVVYETNKGYRIRQIDESEITDLFKIRLDLECFNVRNAIKNLSDEKLKNLKKKFDIYTAYRPAFTDRKKLIYDLAFHLEIAHAGGNSYSIMFSKLVIEHIFFRYRLEQGVEHRKEIIEHEHRNIIESIEKRNIKDAVNYMREHIKALHELMLQYLKNLKM